LAAFQILERVEQGSAHSDDLLHGYLLSSLSQEDRDLTTALVMGTLRWQIALDARVSPLLQRPDLALAEAVRIVLRLGAFQLLYLDRIPAHAALNESVELVREAGHPHAAGMVNAILRKLASAPAPRKPLHETTAVFAERLGHPLWLAERWVKNYGREAAIAICQFDQQEPPCGELFAPRPSGAEGEASALLPRMDDGSRLVAEIAAAAHAEPKRIWDCCAAPGGKTLILAHRHSQAELLATDANARRLKALAERLQREAPEARTKTLVAEAEALPQDAGSFDLILCDVPCSGTGTMARNPEIRHRLRVAEFSRQAARQQAILAAAMARLAPEGRLVYSTCSLEPEENEEIVEIVLAGSKGRYTRVSVDPWVAKLKSDGVLAASADLGQSLREGHLRTLPGYGFHGDGFFATILART
jgi:16S rRNA (cytosine967-C5)-methyltransferase